MATAVARPTGAAVRQRDRLPKLSLSKRGSGLDGDRSSDAPPQKKRKLTEPFVRDTAYILRKHKGKPPSIVLHLYNTHFKFHGQEGSYAYDSPMKFVLEHLRKGTVPHEMIEELLVSGVPWYDGCLIVEVRNYKTKEGEDTVGNGKKDGGGPDGKFSMHRYNEHITPSAFAPYPNKAKSAEEQGTKEGSSNSGTPEKEKEKSKEKASKDGGPQIFTIVLHPTALTQHHEIMLLANTPASELRSNNKKKGSTDVTGASQPPTPSVPPTPTATSRGPLSQQQKMCLEEGDIYAFQSDLLLATEPPLFLDPVSTPQDADRVLDILSDPLHSATPPEAKTRKRTTAEMAADDAQAAEQERRMLIMDERLKPLSTSTAAGGLQGDGQGGAASALGFSRFKTLEMVRAKHEEQERVRKDEEARQAVERKAAEEQNQRQQALLQHQAKQKEMLLQQQRAHAAAQGGGNPNMMAQRNEMLRQQQQQQQQQRQQMEQAQQLAAQQANSAQHGHPQQQNAQAMMQQGGQGFQQPQQVSQMGGAQGSPLARQQTPMLNSSPMMPQGGFPMQPQGSNQGGAGSPARPTSAMMAGRNVSMARQGSQQQGSTHNTPQIAQGTPSMPQAMPNRQMSQTPRLPPGSPAAGMQMGTPNSAHMASMQPTPHMNGSQNGFTPEQLAMLQRQQSIQQQQQHSASPAPGAGGQGGLPQNMTPEQFQAISVQGQQRMRHQQQQLMMAQRSGNQPLANHWQMQMQQQQNREMQARRIREMHALQQAQQQGMAGGGGGHGHPQQTPGGHPQMQPNQMQNQMQVNQHPQQMQGGQGGNPQQMATPDQMAQAQQRSQQMAFQRQLSNQLSTYAQQYGGWQNIPQQAVQTMPPALQNFLRQQKMRAQQQQQQGQMSQAQMQQQQMRMLQMQQQQQQGNMGNGGGMGGGGGTQGGAAGGDNVVPAGAPNPQYMQALRSNRDALAQQMQMQGHMQNMQQQNNGMGMAGMRGGPQGGGGGGGGGGGQNGDDLQQHFANMANALQRPGV
ncbi:hypothetical protein KC363_g6351 [Hortaea werneckii]|uniref:Spt20-like SEP domain-containing protein n=1 Tax=Hortaea werneckii TaxID=91943 RepID=A0A3M7F5P3_HORWE|nr:hypothetical protein KC363_g6351 [Hortaea werneckii]RMY84188.1 hypothetical protein D0861_07084 [Hortaea werneckii]